MRELDPHIELYKLIQVTTVIGTFLENARRLHVGTSPGLQSLAFRMSVALESREKLIQACEEKLKGDVTPATKTRVIEAILSQYVPPEDDEPDDDRPRSLFDDLVDCVAFLPKNARQKRKDSDNLRNAVAKIWDTVNYVYMSAQLPQCIAVFDMVGSQGFHTPDIDLAIGYMYGCLRNKGVRVQDLRPGDDEIVAFFDSESDAIEEAIYSYEVLMTRLNMVMAQKVKFRCALYSEYVYEVQGRPRGPAIIYAARLLGFSKGGQIAISRPTRDKVQHDAELLSKITRTEKKKKDKHGIPHGFFFLKWK